MTDKPTTASGYTPGQLEMVKATCLYVATKLGDLMEDIVIIGGLVPSLLIDQDALADHTEAHVGTMDLDVGLTMALLDEGRYRALTERLRRAGFHPDENEKGNITRQRWVIEGEAKVTIDFLIQPIEASDRGGRLRDIEPDFAAIIAPGLHLAFVNRHQRTLDGRTILGEKASRDVWVCGAGAYLVLKTIAFELRGENKDAYDLFYVLRNYEAGVADVAAELGPLLDDAYAKRALSILRRDFLDPESVGPSRVAQFMFGAADLEIQQDVVGFVSQLLSKMGDLPDGENS
jgi:hypothetical protein